MIVSFISPTRPTELQLSLLVQGGSLRSPRGPAPGRACAPVSARSSPADGRAALTALRRLLPEKDYVVAAVVGDQLPTYGRYHSTLVDSLTP